jgi:hypothetical protein
MEIGEIADRAMAEDRAFETGRASPVRSVGLALRARDRAALEAADLIDITDPAEEN